MALELSVRTSGLIFKVTPELDATRIEALLTPILQRLGTALIDISEFGPQNLQLTCEGLLLWLNVESRAHADPRLRITAQPIAAYSEFTDEKGPLGPQEVKCALASVLATLARDMGADQVQWLAKDMIIPADSFIAAAQGDDAFSGPGPAGDFPRTARRQPPTPVVPRRVRDLYRPGGHARPRPYQGAFAAGLSKRLKAARMAEEAANTSRADHSSLPLRLATWAMTLMLGVFSAPLAWVLFAFNLNRGGDFRVTANVLAGTAGLSLLHTAGSTHTFLNLILG